MAIDLYHTTGSPPCHIVLLTAAALDIRLDLHYVDLDAGDQFKPEFLKLNPQHTVPTIVDDDFSLWESRAIARYLVNKYGADSSLYPTDPKARSLVDQRLDFDLGTLYPTFSQFFYPQVWGGVPPNDIQQKKLEEALVLLNTFLEGRTYAAGPDITLADLSLVTTISTIEASEITLKEYPNILKWYELVKSTAKDYEETNGKGVNDYKKIVAQLKAEK